MKRKLLFLSACVVCLSLVFGAYPAMGKSPRNKKCREFKCPKGYVMDWAYCECVKRPPKPPKNCQQKFCKKGYHIHYNPKTNSCGCRENKQKEDCATQSCQTGFYFNKKRCRCEVNRGVNCEEKKCKPGYRFNYLTCDCEKRPKKRNR